MQKTYDEIVSYINTHLERSGKRYYSDFYIGISKDAVKRMFEDHHVDKKHSWWIYCTANSSDIARKVKSIMWTWACGVVMVAATTRLRWYIFML